jgi:hypothetical protein
MGFAVLGKFAAAAPGTGNASDLPLTYFRAAALFDMAGWDSAVGVQGFSGTQSSLGLGNSSYKATIVDAQMQGEVAGMSLGLYASYGTAPADTNGNNLAGGWSTLYKANGTQPAGIGFSNVDKANSFNVAGTLELVPGVMTVQGGMRFGKIGSYKDNAVMIGGTYELAQNIEFGLNYTTQSGSAWDEFKRANGGTEAVGKNMTTLLMEVLF